MAKVLRPVGAKKALKPRIFNLLVVIAVVSLALTFCEEEKKEGEKDTEEQSVVAESLFLTPSDSTRWLEYLSFAPQDTALAYLMMGTLYLANDAPEGALHYLNIACEHDPDRPVIYLNLGYTYNNLGEYEKATEAFRTYIQRNPGSILSQEIFRIVEKYRSIQSETEIP